MWFLILQPTHFFYNFSKNEGVEVLGIVEQPLHCVLFLPNTPSSSPSFDMTCLQKRCVSVYNQSQLQGCLACYITSAVSSPCLQQAISHSPVVERPRSGAEAVGCAALLPSAGFLSDDTSWGQSPAMGHWPMPPCWGELLPTRSTWELWGPHGKGTIQKETVGMGKVT